jgi:hypothetical protein
LDGVDGHGDSGDRCSTHGSYDGAKLVKAAKEADRDGFSNGKNTKPPPLVGRFSPGFGAGTDSKPCHSAEQETDDGDGRQWRWLTVSTKLRNASECWMESKEKARNSRNDQLHSQDGVDACCVCSKNDNDEIYVCSTTRGDA